MKKLSVFRISDKRLCTFIIIIIIIVVVVVPYLSLFSFIADTNLIALKLGLPASHCIAIVRFPFCIF
jgi:hypothetical protein